MIYKAQPPSFVVQDIVTIHVHLYPPKIKTPVSA